MDGAGFENVRPAPRDGGEDGRGREERDPGVLLPVALLENVVADRPGDQPVADEDDAGEQKAGGRGTLVVHGGGNGQVDALGITGWVVIVLLDAVDLVALQPRGQLGLSGDGHALAEDSIPELLGHECVGLQMERDADNIDADDRDHARADEAANDDGLVVRAGHDGERFGRAPAAGGIGREGLHDGFFGEGRLGIACEQGAVDFEVHALGACHLYGGHDVGERVARLGDPGLADGGEHDDEVAAALDVFADGVGLLLAHVERAVLGVGGGPDEGLQGGVALPAIRESRDGQAGDDLRQLVAGDGVVVLIDVHDPLVLLEPGRAPADHAEEARADGRGLASVDDVFGAAQHATGGVGLLGRAAGAGLDGLKRGDIDGVQLPEWEAHVEPDELGRAGVGNDDALHLGGVAVRVRVGEAEQDVADLVGGIGNLEPDARPIAGARDAADAEGADVDRDFAGAAPGLDGARWHGGARGAIAGEVLGVLGPRGMGQRENGEECGDELWHDRVHERDCNKFQSVAWASAGVGIGR